MTFAPALKRLLLLLVCLAVWPALFPGRAHALGAGRGARCFFTEPTGLKGVRVLSESLLIDLRSMAESNVATIEAAYRLENPGKPRELTLTFIAVSYSGSIQYPTAEGIKARLGKKELEAKEVKAKDLLADWPRDADGKRQPIDLGLPDRFIDLSVCARLKFTLPKGKHTLVLQYTVCPARRDPDPTYLRTLEYVPTPAKEWESFGGLELTVRVPEGWTLLRWPEEMTREGDTWKARFRTAPARNLTFHFQAEPGSAYYRLLWVTWGVIALSVVVGLGGCWWLGRVCGRRRTVAWPAAVGLAVLWAALIWFAGESVVILPEQAAPKGQIPVFAAIDRLRLVYLFRVLALPVGFFVTLVTAVRVRRQAMPNENSRDDRDALAAGVVLVGVGILFVVAKMLGA
ncbi:MAG: hypothetical protein HYS12_14770 [Planctomycetes bacterium]|nr:hypothetical protein [Planctomycetota bacterium]